MTTAELMATRLHHVRPWLALLLAGMLLAAVTAGPPVVSATAGQSPEDSVTLIFFHGTECTHCADARPFLVGLQGRYPALVVEQYEVWHNAENRARLKRTAAEMGFNAAATPVTIVGDRYWVGFSSAIANSIEAAVAAGFGGQPSDAIQTTTIDVPLLGAVDVGSSSLLVSALVIGFVDGVNPCSLWVLSVLLAIVLHSGSRGRVMAVGTTFLIVTTAMYGVYMTGMYSALDYVGEMGWIRLIVAAVALVFGLIHMKDFFWFKEGPSLSIDDARKPGIYSRMRAVAAADKSLPGVLGGTVVLAVGVSLLETPCTAGLPMLWASLLASQGVSLGTAVLLFAVYMFVFLLDELAVLAVAVMTLRATKVQEQHGRLLKLLSGTVMVTLAAAMLLAPSALESVTGTLQVFGFAVAVVAAVWSGSRLVAGVRSR